MHLNSACAVGDIYMVKKKGHRKSTISDKDGNKVRLLSSSNEDNGEESGNEINNGLAFVEYNASLEQEEDEDMIIDDDYIDDNDSSTGLEEREKSKSLTRRQSKKAAKAKNKLEKESLQISKQIQKRTSCMMMDKKLYCFKVNWLEAPLEEKDVPEIKSNESSPKLITSQSSLVTTETQNHQLLTYNQNENDVTPYQQQQQQHAYSDGGTSTTTIFHGQNNNSSNDICDDGNNNPKNNSNKHQNIIINNQQQKNNQSHNNNGDRIKQLSADSRPILPPHKSHKNNHNNNNNNNNNILTRFHPSTKTQSKGMLGGGAIVPSINTHQLTPQQGIKKHYSTQLQQQIRNNRVKNEEIMQRLYLLKKYTQQRKSRKRFITTSKYAAATTAAVTVGIFTAGVGLAAGLALVGITAATGGGSAMAEMKYRRNKGNRTLVLAADTLELAEKWKAAIEAAISRLNLKMESHHHHHLPPPSFTRTASVDTDDQSEIQNETSTWHSFFGGNNEPGTPTSRNSLSQTNTRADSLQSIPDFSLEPDLQWAPLEGGMIFFLGIASMVVGLRVFREQISQQQQQCCNVSRTFSSELRKAFSHHLSVEGTPHPPLKAQVVLNANALNAFMCLMSHSRSALDMNRHFDQDKSKSITPEEIVPNSGQRASFRIIETIDENRDIIHLFFRPLYMFPFWTRPRDFVLSRYWKFDSNGSYHIIYDSVEHADCPPLPTHIRGIIHGVYTISPLRSERQDALPIRNYYSMDQECLLTHVVQIEPRGFGSKIPGVNQFYGEAFALSALSLLLDYRDALDLDRFVPLSSKPAWKNAVSEFKRNYQEQIPNESLAPQNIDDDDNDPYDGHSSDYKYINRERTLSCSVANCLKSSICTVPITLREEKWSEPSANSFLVRGKTYKNDKKKINGGESLCNLLAVDVVKVASPIYSGLCAHPTERVQQALRQEKEAKARGDTCDMPAFIVAVNIFLKGPPNYHLMFYFGVGDMSTIDGSNGTPSSKLANQFFFGNSDEFRDKTFKLIPRIVEGNFLVRKAVGSTPCIMGKAIKQTYAKGDRFFEVFLDTGSSAAAAGVIKLCSGYAKCISTDMAFLLEGTNESTLPERLLGCARIKRLDFKKDVRFVKQPHECEV